MPGDRAVLTPLQSDLHIDVLLDPGDRRFVVDWVAALADRRRGRLVVSPTPGTTSTRLLWQDLVHALGRQFALPEAEVLARSIQPGHLAILLSEAGIRQIYVLRAHRLGPNGWNEMRRLAEASGIRLCFVVHAAGATRTQMEMLHGCQVHVVGLDSLPPPPKPVPITDRGLAWWADCTPGVGRAAPLCPRWVVGGAPH
jgi:hypothetical protein